MVLLRKTANAANELITVERSVEIHERADPMEAGLVALVTFRIASAVDVPVGFRLVEGLPADHPVEDIGLHPDYEPGGWRVSAEEHTLVFEGSVEPGAELVTLFGVRIPDTGSVQPLLSPPVIDGAVPMDRTRAGSGAAEADQTAVALDTTDHGLSKSGRSGEGAAADAGVVDSDGEATTADKSPESDTAALDSDARSRPTESRRTDSRSEQDTDGFPPPWEPTGEHREADEPRDRGHREAELRTEGPEPAGSTSGSRSEPRTGADDTESVPDGADRSDDRLSALRAELDALEAHLDGLESAMAELADEHEAMGERLGIPDDRLAGLAAFDDRLDALESRSEELAASASAELESLADDVAAAEEWRHRVRMALAADPAEGPPEMGTEPTVSEPSHPP